MTVGQGVLSGKWEKYPQNGCHKIFNNWYIFKNISWYKVALWALGWIHKIKLFTLYFSALCCTFSITPYYISHVEVSGNTHI